MCGIGWFFLRNKFRIKDYYALTHCVGLEQSSLFYSGQCTEKQPNSQVVQQLLFANLQK